MAPAPTLLWQRGGRAIRPGCSSRAADARRFAVCARARSTASTTPTSSLARAEQPPLPLVPAPMSPLRGARRQRRDAPLCRAGFLGSLFGGKPPSLPGASSTTQSNRRPALEDDLGDEDPDEVVLVETDVPAVPGRRCRIVYRNGAPVDAATVEALCAKVGWPQRPRAKLEAALRNSFLVASLHVQVLDESGAVAEGGNGGNGASSSSETLVGLARATSDHAFNATIWDVIVDPDYQGQGLGRALVEQVVRALLRREIGNVTLFADAKVVEFYRQMGFECDPEGIKGMFWYPR